MDIAKTISANLTAWMDADNALDTIKKVEEKSGVGFGTVRRTKKGDANITVEKLTMIASAFKRHPAELLIDHELGKDYTNDLPANDVKAAEPQADRYSLFSPIVGEVIEIMESLSHEQQRDVLSAIQMFLLATNKNKHNPGKRAEQ